MKSLPMNSPEEIVVDLPHIRLAGLRFGQGKQVIFALHGWLDNAMSFAPLAQALAGDDVSIIALDFAGHGHSAHRPRASGYHFSDYLRDVILAADYLGIERLDLLCHSMGAAVGTLLAGAFPERVARLACIELYGVATVSDDEPLPKRFREILMQLDYMQPRPDKVYQDYEALIRARRGAGDIRPENAALLLSRNTSKGYEGYRFLSDRRLRIWQPSLLSEAQMMSFIEAIQSPVLVIEGEQGYAPHWTFLPPRYAATGDIQVQRLSGGHHLHMDNPQAVAACLRAFWQSRPIAA